LQRFANALCKNHLEPKFCSPYTASDGWGDAITKTDGFYYALNCRGLSFTLALGSDDIAAGKNGAQEFNKNEVWPRTTQVISLHPKADLVGALLDFDTSIAACAYDGITVRVAPRAAYSLLNSVQIVTPNVLKEQRNRSRIVKYYKRGFDAYMLDPYCSRPAQRAYDLELRFPQFAPSTTGGRREINYNGADVERTSVEWRAPYLHEGMTYSDILDEVGGRWDRDEEQCITACHCIAQGSSDERCIALFEIRPGHAIEFLSKRHGWTEDDRRLVASYPSTRCFTCQECRYEYAIWLVFSGDSRVNFLDFDLRDDEGGLSFLFGTNEKGGITHFSGSFYGCPAFNSRLVRDSARTIEQMGWLIQSQHIAERARYLVQHLGEEECTTYTKFSLYSESKLCPDRFVADESLDGVLSVGERRVFPSSAKAPVGLNPERFVEVCKACSQYLLGCEFGTTLCKQCESQ